MATTIIIMIIRIVSPCYFDHPFGWLYCRKNLFIAVDGGALDAQMRVSLQDSLLSIWQNTHVTIVFVTHDVDEAIRLSQRVVIISQRSGSISSIIETNKTHNESIEQSAERTHELKSRCLTLLSA